MSRLLTGFENRANRAFLDHIGAVLPALGEVEVSHATIEDLLATVPVRGVDSVETAVLKGDSRLAELLTGPCPELLAPLPADEPPGADAAESQR